MSNRNEVELFINGRKHKISGSESPAYLQKAADYINEVYEEVKSIPGFNRTSPYNQNLMMYLNLADRYMKAVGWNEDNQAKQDEKDAEEISALKMELADMQKALADADSRLKAAEAKFREDNEALSSENGTLKVRLSRVQDQERQYEEKVRTLEKETDSQRTEISVLKRKVTDYVKSSAEQERVRKELEQQVENGGNATLLRAQIEELESQVALMQQDAVNTRGSKQRMREEMERLQEQNAGLQKQLTAVNEERDALKTNVQKQLATAQASVEDELEKRVEECRSRYEKELALKDGQCEDQMIELRADYENRMAAMRLEQDSLTKEQEARLSEKDQVIADLQKEVYGLKEKSKDGQDKAEELEGLRESLAKSQDAELNSIKEITGLKQRIEELTLQRNSAAQELEGVRAKLSESLRQAQVSQNAAPQADNSELADRVKSLEEELNRANERNAEMEGDMIEYLDLIEEKEREIGRLKYKLTEGNYE